MSAIQLEPGNWRMGRLAFGAPLVIACLLAGCALSPKPFLLAQVHDPESVRLVKLNHVGQKARGDRGVGALAMVYQFWGHDISYQQILSELQRAKGKRATVTAADLKAHAEAKGFYAFVIRTTLDDLREQINQGRPVIVCRKSLWSANHYEVVFGYDTKRKEILIDDPAKGQLRRSERAFARQHRRTGGFSLLIVPQ